MSACELADPFTALLGTARGRPERDPERVLDARRRAWRPCLEALFAELGLEHAKLALQSVGELIAPLRERAGEWMVDSLVHDSAAEEFANAALADPMAMCVRLFGSDEAPRVLADIDACKFSFLDWRNALHDTLNREGFLPDADAGARHERVCQLARSIKARSAAGRIRG